MSIHTRAFWTEHVFRTTEVFIILFTRSVTFDHYSRIILEGVITIHSLLNVCIDAEVQIDLDISREVGLLEVGHKVQSCIRKSERYCGQSWMLDGGIDRVDMDRSGEQCIQLPFIKRLVGVVDEVCILPSVDLGQCLNERIYKITIDKHSVTCSRFHD